MKQISILIFSIFYLLVSTGISFNLHYCGGKIENISFNQSKIKQCCGGAVMSKNCCQNKTISLKAAEKHTLNQNIVLDFSQFLLFQPLERENIKHIFSERINPSAYNNHPPPRTKSCPTYLKNRILLI